MKQFVIIVFGFFISFWDKLSLCQEYFGLGFDQQSFLYWDYAKHLGLIPFRDFFYPYGLLFFFKIDSQIWHIASVFFSFVLLGSAFLILKKVFKDKLYTYSFFIIFCVFINLFVNFDTFIRYAPILPVCLLISHLISKKVLFRIWSGLSLGLSSGLLFSFINDLFFYTFVLVLFISTVYWFIEIRKVNREIIKFILFFSIGILIGSLPLIIFLSENNAISGFITNYRVLKEVSSFAKVPFPPILKSFENDLIILTIILSIFSLIPGFREKNKRDFSFYLKLTIVTGLLLLEQKNIVRSFYTQISFLALVLTFISLANFKTTMVRLKINKKLIYLFMINLITLIFIVVYLDRGHTLVKAQTVQGSEICYQKKLKYSANDLKSYLKVKDYVLAGNYNKIYSFPGDPVFYILFNQKPPPYPSIYEATAVFAQEELINYIKANKINFIVINLKSTAIQDGVPDKIRAKRLYKFISSNFTPVKKIGHFQIFKKK